MRENRTCGSEGGEAQSLPYPYPAAALPGGAFGETPMRASPADYKSALHLGGGPCPFFPLPALPHSCPPRGSWWSVKGDA